MVIPIECMLINLLFKTMFLNKIIESGATYILTVNFDIGYAVKHKFAVSFNLTDENSCNFHLHR